MNFAHFGGFLLGLGFGAVAMLVAIKQGIVSSDMDPLPLLGALVVLGVASIAGHVTRRKSSKAPML